MSFKNLTLTTVLVLFCGMFLSACSLNNSTSINQTTPVGETTVEQDMAEPQPTFPNSTQVDDLDKELTEFEIPAEDYSDL